MPTPLPTLHDWRLSVDYEGIAWALMDREGERVNSMGRRFTEELGETVKWTETVAIHGEIKGLVLMSAKPTGFLVGADIREFSRFATEEADKKLERAIRRGEVHRYYGNDWIAEAEKKGVITAEEAAALAEVRDLTARVIAVDHFEAAAFARKQSAPQTMPGAFNPPRDSIAAE